MSDKRKTWVWLGSISIVVLLCAYFAYVKRYGPGSDYHTGFLLGSSSFSVADINDLHCLELETEALQHGYPSPNCEFKDLNGDSAMEEAMKSLSISDIGEEARQGFKDGWRYERQKAFASRDKQK
jgi:hypothetical protein